MTAQDVAAVLAEHPYRGLGTSPGVALICGCSFTSHRVGMDYPHTQDQHRAHVAEQLAPLLAAEYERGLADGRAQVVAAVTPALDLAFRPGNRGIDGGRYIVSPVEAEFVYRALAPHADALAKHDAEVLRAAADDAFEEWCGWGGGDFATWLRDRADRIDGGAA